jgi:multiple sugar transport system ATP-binding protein
MTPRDTPSRAAKSRKWARRSAMAAVTIAGVQKWFGATHIIRGVDVAIADGEFCVLVGPSGCGKSTLLRMIAGLEEISHGEVTIAGRVVNRVPPKERDIAMVFQNYALYPHMTVRDNMSFALMLAKLSKAAIEAQVAKAADILGLAPYLDRYPRQLSGGQRQRVAMGRAIVRDPQVFLFDEPLSNLDAKLRVQMRAEIKELHQRLKTTSIYVTHDQIEAMTMADKIVVMKDGLVEQTGGPLELYDHPANVFVAGFIGSPAMNIIPGTAHNRAGMAHVAFADGATLPLPKGAHAVDGQPVFYGIRPEHCALTGDGGLPADIVVVEPTGADTQLYCRFNGQEVNAMVRDRVDCRPGDRIALTPDLGRAHLFDAASGTRLAA